MCDRSLSAPGSTIGPVRSAPERRELLKAVYEEARGCQKCQLHRTRTTVVFGAGNADADLMFVGEAPGANEDRLGLPFVGQAGKLLEKLLGEIDLQRSDVFIANTVMCRPPQNRDPHPPELESCNGYLRQKISLIAPVMICTLGNFATKLLRADPGTGITRLHGREEERVLGPLAVRLYPLLHPAAALYTPSMLASLRADFERIPELLALPPLPQPAPVEVAAAVPEPELVRVAGAPAAGGGAPAHAGGRELETLEPSPERESSPDHGDHVEEQASGAGEPPAQLGLF